MKSDGHTAKDIAATVAKPGVLQGLGADVVEFCDCRLRRGSMMSSATGCMTVVMTPDGSSRENPHS
jgi:hypothetical protein